MGGSYYDSEIYRSGYVKMERRKSTGEIVATATIKTSCPYCGTLLTTEQRCPSCGSPRKEEKKHGRRR
jgi:rubrerythrin